MKTLLTIFIGIMTILCQGQNNSYNDWFDMNLKEKPKLVKEISIFPLDDFSNPELKIYLNSTINQMLFIDEFHFDSLGLILKEFHKDILDTIGHWIDYKTEKKVIQYKDSIILIGFFPNGQEAWKEKRYLEKNEFLSSRIRDFPNIDTTLFERDKNNRVIKSYYHLIGTDSQAIILIDNKFDDNGDLILQKSLEKRFGIMYRTPSINETVTAFSYIYDSFNNWIFKISMRDNKINMITQREIKYK
jgi:hypothetical protein